MKVLKSSLRFLSSKWIFLVVSQVLTTKCITIFLNTLPCFREIFSMSTCRHYKNIHFYDENLNDESETVIEEHFLCWIFLFHHRSVVTILQPSFSMTKSGIVTKNITEEHRVSSQITRATHLWRSPLKLWRIGLCHWTNYTFVMNNIRSVTNDFVVDLHTVLSPSDVYLWDL